MPENTRILVLNDKTVVPLDSGSGSLRYSSMVLFFAFPVVLCSCEWSKCENTKAYHSGVKELGIKFKYSHIVISISIDDSSQAFFSAKTSLKLMRMLARFSSFAALSWRNFLYYILRASKILKFLEAIIDTLQTLHAFKYAARVEHSDLRRSFLRIAASRTRCQGNEGLKM
ncbi:hypothetical protein NC653_000450 [Populus alba x Populus x berolinensis]|uniref:Uncharacterized protein n=1 Tax=Populus alba x Populus x berolinensis TaxID=444605 RepID=A0AAD6WGN8_9ROSI|nr:hypothetical protein NC653_000450 [Populus alba x Populus x berolinensis]